MSELCLKLSLCFVECEPPHCSDEEVVINHCVMAHSLPVLIGKSPKTEDVETRCLRLPVNEWFLSTSHEKCYVLKPLEAFIVDDCPTNSLRRFNKNYRFISTVLRCVLTGQPFIGYCIVTKRSNPPLIPEHYSHESFIRVSFPTCTNCKRVRDLVRTCSSMIGCKEMNCFDCGHGHGSSDGEFFSCELEAGIFPSSTRFFEGPEFYGSDDETYFSD